ncbi:MAG: SIR2 family protein [Planctomycetota bacterium]|nr:SIR2 family protein [Planctomycetota bacterium]
MPRDELINDLKAHVADGDVVAIVGAGVSLSATEGNPLAGWTGLLLSGVEYGQTVTGTITEPQGKLLRDQIQSADPDFLVSAAEVITKRLGGHKSGQFHRWLQDKVGALRAKDRTVIKALHALPVLITTTNYDSLIEEVTQRPHVTWKEQAAVERWLRGETTDAVLHLHGWWDQPESVVLSLRAYEDVTGDEHAQAVLRCLRTRNTLLFVGCGGGLEDPNFSRLRQWATATFEASTYRHFRLCLDSELEALATEQREHPWLFPVGYGDGHDKLSGFLRSLAPASGTARRTPAPKPTAAAGLDLDRYRDGLQKRYGYLKLESLDASPDHRRIALTKIFVEPTVRSCQQFNPRVYELPIEHRHRLEEQGGLEWDLNEEELKRQRESFLQQSPTPVVEAISDPDHRLCVVLGDPGSGKSVLLDYLAMQWAELPPVERPTRPIPLLIELKTYAENLGSNRCRDFLEYLDHGTGVVGQFDQPQLNAALQRGQATFLLDGLDEIFDAPARQRVVQDLVRFTIRYPQARFLITSRVIGYDFVAPLLHDAGFQHFLLQELNDVQQTHFIGRWHDLAYADPTERAEKATRLQQSIAHVAAIQELAQNPLLLTLMALLNRHQELPRDRNELYEQASRLMLQQWDATRAIREAPLLAQQSFDYKDKQAMLRAVAFRMQTNPKGLAGNVIARDDLEQTLVDYLRSQGYDEPRPVAKRLIHQLRDRNFVLCLLGGDYYAFVHRAFLDFFCAWAWVWKFEKEKRLLFENLQHDAFDAHWPDETWHEVLRLIAARLEPCFAGRLIVNPNHRRSDTQSIRTIRRKCGNCSRPLRQATRPVRKRWHRASGGGAGAGPRLEGRSGNLADPQSPCAFR